jgi:predicted amidohydrolase
MEEVKPEFFTEICSKIRNRMNDLRISIVQSEIAWEDKAKNLTHYYSLLSQLKGKSDLAVLPEMCTTGFSMNVAHLAETNAGNTIQTIQSWAKELDLAVSGSFVAKETDERLFNRGFFITPAGETYFSDKRHLFRIGEENNYFTPAASYSIIPYKGWNIRLIVCYDLRFPVWIRNRENEYDLLLCVANWPQSRATVWNCLLKARAIENLCYVCGANRVGKDGNDILYQGDSVVLDYKGNVVGEAKQNQESVITTVLNKEKLQDFREKFPVWKDADPFAIL